MQKKPNLRTTGPFYLIQSVLICSSGFVTCKWKTKKRFPNQWYSSQLSCKQWNMVNTTQKKPILRLNPENRPFFQAGNIRQHFRFYFSDHYQNPSTVKKKKSSFNYERYLEYHLTACFSVVFAGQRENSSQICPQLTYLLLVNHLSQVWRGYIHTVFLRPLAVSSEQKYLMNTSSFLCSLDTEHKHHRSSHLKLRSEQ